MNDIDRPQLELVNLKAHEPDDVFTDDDEPPEQHLEVTFAPPSISRRKSSFPAAHAQAPPPTSSPRRRPAPSRRRTSLFVHGFLEDRRLHPEPVKSNEPKSQSAPVDKVTSPELAEAQLHHANNTDTPGPRLPRDHGHLADVLEDPSVQSRLLTKKELSDMAFGIRELSKRLSHFKLKLKVHNVFLLTKAHDQTLISFTREVAAWLLSKESGDPHTVYVEDTLQHNTRFAAEDLAKDPTIQPGSSLRFWNNELCRRNPNAFDIVLALGGDGTVLYASWLFQRIVPPVLSFALGSLGFLTKFDAEGYRKTLGQAFEEGLTVSVRLRLEATVMRAQSRTENGEVDDSRDLIDELIGEERDDMRTHKPEMSYNILNDVVMDRGPNPTMSSLEVFGDNFHITTVQADGVCVATPTGSTAYNLAAGGSLCHPDNPVLLVTAICAHTLSFRPILLPDTMVLRVGVPYDARTNPWVSFDGKERVMLGRGDYVTISASRYPFATVLPLGTGSEDWIDSLSRTLNWNSRQRQKAFKD